MAIYLNLRISIGRCSGGAPCALRTPPISSKRRCSFVADIVDKASIPARNMLTAADNFLQKQQKQRRRQLLPASSAPRRAKELEHGRLLARFSTVRARR